VVVRAPADTRADAGAAAGVASAASAVLPLSASRKGLGKEVGHVFLRRDERDVDLEGLNHVAHEEVTTRHVLHPIMKLGVVRNVASGHVVRTKVSRAADRGLVEASDELAGIDNVLGSLGERDEFGFARRKSDALLLARSPRERRVAPHDDPARGRVANLPRCVREGVQVGRSRGRVEGDADGTVARKVRNDAVCLLHQLGRRLG